MTSCDASDMTKLNALTKTTFDAETKHCALECGGQNPCVGDCIARDYGYSKSCAMCFGDLTSCAVANCVVAPGNCGVDPNGSACAKCMADKCDGKFKTCTGVATPTLELGDSGCASWCHWITNPNTLKLLPECSGCSGVAGVATPTMLEVGPESAHRPPSNELALPMADSCDASDMTKLKALTKSSFDAETKHCALECGGQNPCTGNCVSRDYGYSEACGQCFGGLTSCNCVSRDYGYSKACGQCFGGLTSCTVAHCVVAPGNCGVDPNGSDCSKCVNQHCTPAFETCTGWTTPALAKLRDDMPAGAVLCPGFQKDAYCDCDPESDCTNDWLGVNTCTCDAAKACCAAAAKPKEIPSGAPRMFAPKRVSSA